MSRGVHKILKTFVFDLVVVAGAYADGEALGEKFTLTDAVTRVNGSGKIISITVVDRNELGIAFDVMFVNEDFTPTAQQAAINTSSTDDIKVAGLVRIASPDYTDVGAALIATKPDINLGYRCVTRTDLVGQCIARDSGTFAATNDMQLTIVVEQEQSING